MPALTSSSLTCHAQHRARFLALIQRHSSPVWHQGALPASVRGKASRGEQRGLLKRHLVPTQRVGDTTVTNFLSGLGAVPRTTHTPDLRLTGCAHPLAVCKRVLTAHAPDWEGGRPSRAGNASRLGNGESSSLQQELVLLCEPSEPSDVGRDHRVDSLNAVAQGNRHNSTTRSSALVAQVKRDVSLNRRRGKKRIQECLYWASPDSETQS